MKSIKAEGVSFKYIFANEVIDEKDNLFISGHFLWGRNVPVNIYKELQGGVNTRLAIFKKLLPQTDPGPRRIEFGDDPFCLVWLNDKIDLNMLDKKVMDNSFSDQDFYDSIRARVLRLICFNCRNEYIALIADTLIYIAEDENGKPDQFLSNLLNNKFSNLKSERCPNCNNSFTMYAIKILYKCTDDS